jgi:hypothetical protein
MAKTSDHVSTYPHVNLFNPSSNPPGEPVINCPAAYDAAGLINNNQ